MATCGDLESRVLDFLESVERGVAGVWGPDRGGVVDCRLDEVFESAEEELFLATPSSSGEGAEDAEFLLA